MTPDGIALAAIVILLFPMGYFLLASPPFLFVRLDIEPVALLLRGLFNAYFVMMTIAGAVVTMAFAVAGRPVSAICIGLMTAFAVSARRWEAKHHEAEEHLVSFEGADITFQVAIVLCSMCIVLQSRRLLQMALAVGGGAALMLLNGFFLWVKF